MLNVLADKARYVKILLNENSTTLLTGAGVAGVGATAYFTGRASFKAARLIDAERENVENAENGSYQGDLSRSDKIKLTWKFYILPTAISLSTIAAIIMSQRISAKRIAALTIASGISERALREYKEKVFQKFGENKITEVRDEIAQDRITKDETKNREVIAVGTGEVLCYDMHTGRYFTSIVEDIRKAENKINYELIHFGSASLSEFYDEIGLPATSYSDLVGWNMNNHMEVVFSTTMTPDSRPCIAIDFRNPPTHDYNKSLYDG